MTFARRCFGAWYLVAVAAAVMLWPAMVAAQEGVAATHAEVTLAIQADGTLRVREELALTFGRATKTFERRVNHDQVDDISNVQAFFDGASVPVGRGVGEAVVETGHSLRVRWTLPSVTGPHTLGLTYTASGVFGVESGRRHLRWPAIANHGFPIHDAVLTLDAAPTIEFYPATGIAEAGWQVSREGNKFVARATNLGARTHGTFVAEIADAGLGLPIPQWQFDEDRAAQFFLAWISGAIFIFVVGAGILWILQFQYPSAKVRTRQAAAAEAPMAPAMAMTVAHRISPNRPGLFLGTLVDLVQRGHVRVAFAGRRDVTVTRVDIGDEGLLAHERIVLDLLPSNAEDRTALASRVRDRLVRTQRRFARAVVQDLVEAGHADIDRIRVSRGLVVSGLAVVGLGLASALAVGLTMRRFGPWPMALPVTTTVVGLALLIRGATFSIVTSTGESVSAEWRARLRDLRAAEHHGGAVDVFARWLPIAVANGRGPAWIKGFASTLASAPPLAWYPIAPDTPAAQAIKRVIDVLKPRNKAH